MLFKGILEFDCALARVQPQMDERRFQRVATQVSSDIVQTEKLHDVKRLDQPGLVHLLELLKVSVRVVCFRDLSGAEDVGAYLIDRLLQFTIAAV